MDSLLEEIVNSPRLPAYLDELQRIFEEEKARRERFIEEVSESQKAEFINGTPVYHSPVKVRHAQVSDRLLILVKAYVMRHRLGFVGHEKLMVSLTRNDYEPDLIYYTPERAASLTPDQMRLPAPDLIAEVLSPSTEKTDRGIKFEDYAAHGVREYWIIDPDGQTVERYALQEDRFILQPKADPDVLQSEVITGFTLPVRALFDDAASYDSLQAILSKPPTG
jgi:Uma2 family endonuclease